MAWLRAAWRKYRTVAGIAIRSRIHYPLDMVGPVFTYTVFVGIFCLVWAAAVPEGTKLAGYSRFDLSWYFMFAELVIFAGGSVYLNLASEIRDGQVAYTLGRPLSYLTYTLSQYLGTMVVQLPFFLVPGALICTLAVGPWIPADPAHLVMAIGGLVLGVVLKFFLHTAVSLTAFWVEDNTAFYWILSKFTLITGTLMPLEFLPDWLQGPMALTPFPWVSWGGASLFVHGSGAGGGFFGGGLGGPGQLGGLGHIGGLAAWVLILGLVSALVFRAGARQTTVQGG